MLLAGTVDVRHLLLRQAGEVHLHLKVVMVDTEEKESVTWMIHNATIVCRRRR